MHCENCKNFLKEEVVFGYIKPVQIESFDT